MATTQTSGFTLIELIVIMMIIGVLSALALPRFFNRGDFDSRGFYDQTLAALRYAQKSAIAQRRTVCVDFNSATPNTVTLTIAALAGSATCGPDLVSPTGQSPFQITAPVGVSFTPVPSDFQFNALGQANIATPTQTIQVYGATGNIVIERDTGYVHP